MTHTENRSLIYKVELDSAQKNDARIIASEFISYKSNVLDVGCACGDFGVFLSREKECQVYGMEYDPLSLDVARNKNVFIQLHQVDLNNMQANEHPYYYSFFDYITILDVLEHTVSPADAMLNLIPYLKADGFFVISLPNISFGDIKFSLLQDDFTYTDMGILDKTHLRFFTHKTIASFFTGVGLEVVDSKAKVSDIIFSTEGIPFYVRRFVRKNPHSYISQYVVKVKLSKLDQSSLLNQNLVKLDFDWSDISSELYKILIKRWINSLFPIGSSRKLVAMFIHKLLRKVFSRESS